MEEKRIRITLKRTQPNPLFEKWLKEFIAIAEKKNTKSQFQLKKALNSLQKYPLPLETGRDCIILEGFGRGICELIDKKLEDHINGQISSTKPVNSIVELNESYRQSEGYKKQKEKENLEILEKVSENLVKDGQISKKVPRKPAKKKKAETQVNFEIYEMKDYEVILLVDTQETIGKSKAHLDRTIQELNRYKVAHEVRRLSVGDFLWIARDNAGHELVLPYIVERKRKDDLASSIKDGRFYEQKYRLKQCGLENVIYLIESIGGNDQSLGLPIQNLLQAATNTAVQNGFQVRFTDNNPHSVMFLHVVSSHLNKLYQGKTLVSCEKKNLPQETATAAAAGERREYLMEFSEFNKMSSKSKDPTVQEIFIKQLLQLKGLSVDKAMAIANSYPTLRNLFLAYDACKSTVEREELLAGIQYGPLKRTIGSAMSKTIYQLYWNTNPS